MLPSLSPRAGRVLPLAHTEKASQKISQKTKQTVVVGADIGGTFTDVIIVDHDSRTWSQKVLTTTHDYSRGIAEAVADLGEKAGLSAAEISGVVHGTTVATNVILEGKGAKTALITIRGFRDVLELRRLRVPRLFSAPLSAACTACAAPTTLRGR